MSFCKRSLSVGLVALDIFQSKKPTLKLKGSVFGDFNPLPTVETTEIPTSRVESLNGSLDNPSVRVGLPI